MDREEHRAIHRIEPIVEFDNWMLEEDNPIAI